MIMASDLLLPAGSRLVHIGPHKTGTTAVQFAFHTAREQVEAQGVHYAWKTSQAYRPALGLTGRRGRIGGPVATEDDWLELVAECRDAGDRRVVISSESFANAGRDDIGRLADDLGRDRVHIVRMIRRYDAMLPSQWQQQVAGGGTTSYPDYLDKALADRAHPFWKRHGFAGLTRKWSGVVGADRVSVVSVDESDREWLLRVFEELVGLTRGTLGLVQSRANRSLTWGEVELVRALNIVRRDQGWVDRVHFDFVRRGVSPALRTLPSDPESGRFAVPERIVPLLEDATERDRLDLERLGVRIIGDLAALSPRAGSTGMPSPASLSVSSAVAAAGSVVDRAREIEGFPLGEGRTRVPAAVDAAPHLTAAEERLVAELRDLLDETDQARFVDGGLLPWLRSAPRVDEAIPEGRLDPTRVAWAVSGVLAVTDPRR